MITVRLSHHKDQGNHLLLERTPWWAVVIDSAVGSYNPRFGWDYRIWNRILEATLKRHREVYSVPIDDFCEASVALWGSEFHMCWKEDCPYGQ